MRLLIFVGVLTATVGLAVACDDASGDADVDDLDASGSPRESDASTTDRADAAVRDAETKDATAETGAKGDEEGDAGPGAECFFNADCKKTLRCECDDAGCACQPGTRGTGAAGDPCANGNACASSICIDETTCSAACEQDDDCPDALPRCLFVFGSPQMICTPD